MYVDKKTKNGYSPRRYFIRIFVIHLVSRSVAPSRPDENLWSPPSFKLPVLGVAIVSIVLPLSIVLPQGFVGMHSQSCA